MAAIYDLRVGLGGRQLRFPAQAAPAGLFDFLMGFRPDGTRNLAPSFMQLKSLMSKQDRAYTQEDLAVIYPAGVPPEDIQPPPDSNACQPVGSGSASSNSNSNSTSSFSSTPSNSNSNSSSSSSIAPSNPNIKAQSGPVEPKPKPAYLYSDIDFENFTEGRKNFLASLQTTGVPVYQRGYGVCKAVNHRHILTTAQISPCICVLVYKPNTQLVGPSNAVAALAHFDKAQDFDSLNDILNLPDFGGPEQVQIHFYGGVAGLDSRNTVNELLSNLFKNNLRHGRFVLAAFDVISCAHNTGFSFDVSTGRKYTTGSPGFDRPGFWLDSGFRFWLDGRYMDTQDGSALAVLGEADQVAAVQADLKKIRLQWNGGEQAEDFYRRTNKIICDLVMREARLVLVASKPSVILPDDGSVLRNCRTVLTCALAAMSFEQSLKSWLMYCEKTKTYFAVDGKKSTATVTYGPPSADDKQQANATIVMTMVDLCRASATQEQMSFAVAKWIGLESNDPSRRSDMNFP